MAIGRFHGVNSPTAASRGRPMSSRNAELGRDVREAALPRTRPGGLGGDAPKTEAEGMRGSALEKAGVAGGRIKDAGVWGTGRNSRSRGHVMTPRKEFRFCTMRKRKTRKSPQPKRNTSRFVP